MASHHRTRSKDRCPRCRITRVLCVCALIPCVDLKTKVIVLLHKRESHRPTNTGRLLSLCLSNSEVRIRGDLENPLNEEGIVEAGRETLLLYPSERAVELTGSFARSLTKPVTLVVPDGSWRQAAKVMNREPVLKNVIHVKVPVDAAPALQLKKQSRPDGLSTFEAVARALGVLENVEARDSLERFFRTVAERVLWSRAQLLAERCETEIPAEAFR